MLLGLNALRIPTGRPTSQETMRASTPISALMGPRWAISSATVSPRKNDLPSRPAPMSTSQRPYCTGSGSLSPRSAMMRTRSVGLHLRVALGAEDRHQRIAGQDAQHHEDGERDTEQGTEGVHCPASRYFRTRPSPL